MRVRKRILAIAGDGGPTVTAQSGEAALDIEAVLGLAPGAIHFSY